MSWFTPRRMGATKRPFFFSNLSSDKPFIVGVTGGIGSGKSQFCNIFKYACIPVFNSDLEARAMMNENAHVRRNVIKYFGEGSYSNGELNRPLIASIVFSNKEKLNILNSIALPRLWKRFHRWHAKQISPYVLIESATLVDHGGMDHIDHLVVVTAPMDVRIERAMKRDGATIEQVTSRMNNQSSDEEMIVHANTIIMNDGSLENLYKQAVDLQRYLYMVTVSGDREGYAKT